MAAVVILLWMVIGYVGFRTAICRGHELNITDREALKGTSWDQYYEEIQEGIEWINRQEAEDIFIRSEDGFKLHGRLMDQPGAKGTVLMFHGYRTHPEVDFSASSHVYYECGNRIVHIDQRAAGESEGKYIGFSGYWRAETAVCGRSILQNGLDRIRKSFWPGCPWEHLRC